MSSAAAKSMLIRALIMEFYSKLPACKGKTPQSFATFGSATVGCIRRRPADRIFQPKPAHLRGESAGARAPEITTMQARLIPTRP
jgi:hypothetical protein